MTKTAPLPSPWYKHTDVSSALMRKTLFPSGTCSLNIAQPSSACLRIRPSSAGLLFGTYPERRAGLPHLGRMGSDRIGARGPTVIIIIIIIITIIIIIIIFLDS